MPRLAERAAETLGHLPPKAVEVLAGTGFAAAGVVAVLAENLKTLTDRDEPLPGRARKVGQTSLGVLLSPATLPQRGRQLVGRDGNGRGEGDARGDGDARGAGDARGDGGARGGDGGTTPRPTEARDGGTTPRPTQAGGVDTSARSAPDDQAVPPRGIDTSSAEAAPATSKPASRAQDDEAGAGREQAEKAKEQAQEAKQRAAKQRAEEAKQRAAKQRAEEAEQRAERAASQTTEERQPEGANGRRTQEDTPDVPAGVDEGLVRDLQRMTVKQLRERAAQDGIAGRSQMGKDELITALATRETDDAPAKR